MVEQGPDLFAIIIILHIIATSRILFEYLICIVIPHIM